MRTSHRTWFKVLLNPLLRHFFNIHIVSCFTADDDKLVGYQLRKVKS